MLGTEQANVKVQIDGQQAEDSLVDLKTRATDLRKELQKAKLNDDKEGHARLKKEYNDLQRQIDNTKKSTTSLEKVMNNLSGTSMRDLQLASNKLKGEIRKMNRETEDEIKLYKQKITQLQKVESELRKVKNEQAALASKQGAFSRMADGFNKYFGLITTFAASFTGVVLGLRQTITAFNEFEESVANLSALTGLTGADLEWLSNKAKELSVGTTESGIRVKHGAKEILDAYTLMGSAKPELLKNKDALNLVTEKAIELATAAKMDLSPAVEALANTMNQFSAPAEEASRYINVLAAGSKEGAAAIPDISASIVKFGAAAASANVSVEQSVALIETLAEKGLKGELAGTQLKNVLLKLQTGADDTNPSIVGLNKALDNLAAKNLSATEMTKLFGLESYTAAQILVSNTDRVNYFSTAVEGTSIALEQAAKNGETNATKLAQAVNNAQLRAIELGEKISPAFTVSTNAMGYFLKALVAVIDNFKLWVPYVTAAATAMTAYIVIVKGGVLAKKAYEAVVLRALIAQEAFNKAAIKNPWGLILAASAAVIAFLVTYSREITTAAATTKRLSDATDDYNGRIANEMAMAEQLFSALKKTNAGSDERKRSIDAINQRYGLTLKNLENEKDFLTQINTAYKQVTASIKQKALQEVLAAQMGDLMKEELDIRKKIKEIDDNMNKTDIISIGVRTDLTEEQIKAQQMLNDAVKAGNSQTSEGVKYYEKELANIDAQRTAVVELVEQMSRELGVIQTVNDENTNTTTTTLDKSTAYEALNKKIAEYNKLLQDQVTTGSAEAPLTAEKIRGLQEEKQAIDDVIKSLTDFSIDIEDGNITLPEFKVDTGFDQDSWTSSLDQLMATSKEALTQLYLDKKISMQEMNRELAAVEIAHLEKMQQAAKASGYSTVKIEKQIADKRMAIVKDSNEAEKIEMEKKIQFYGAVGEAAGNVLQGFLEGQIKTVEDFGRMIVSSMLDVLWQIIEIRLAEAAATSIAAPDSVFTFGAVGIARYAIIAGLIKAAIAGAKTLVMSGMSTNKETATPTTPQYASGRLTVKGAQDGKIYNAPYVGAPKTGYYPNPAIISESGGEIIVDAYRSRQIMMNYPYLLEAIKSVPQHASGTLSNNTETNNYVSENTTLRMAIEELVIRLNKGIKAYTVYSENQDIDTRAKEIENRVKTR